MNCLNCIIYLSIQLQILWVAKIRPPWVWRKQQNTWKDVSPRLQDPNEKFILRAILQVADTSYQKCNTLGMCARVYLSQLLAPQEDRGRTLPKVHLPEHPGPERSHQTPDWWDDEKPSEAGERSFSNEITEGSILCLKGKFRGLVSLRGYMERKHNLGNSF